MTSVPVVLWVATIAVACGGKSNKPPGLGDPGYVSTAHDQPKVTKVTLTKAGAPQLCPGTTARIVLEVVDDKGEPVGTNWLRPEWTVKPEGVELSTPKQDLDAETLFTTVSSPLPDNPDLAIEPIVVSVTLLDFPGVTASIEIPQALSCEKGGAIELSLAGSAGANGSDGGAWSESAAEGENGSPGSAGRDSHPAVDVEVANVALADGRPVRLVVGQVSGGDRLHARVVPMDAEPVDVLVNGGKGGDGGKGGPGRPGSDSDGTCRDPGTGGKGGDGGNGGDAGKVALRAASKEMLEKVMVFAKGGEGGAGGRGGSGGVRCDDKHNAGLAGKAGKDGKAGAKSTFTAKVVPAAQLKLIQAYLAEHPKLKLLP